MSVRTRPSGDKVVDSRESGEGEVIRRRRSAWSARSGSPVTNGSTRSLHGGEKDGTRERFERQKLVAGLLKACEKRPVSMAALEGIADRVESAAGTSRKEIATADIGCR